MKLRGDNHIKWLFPEGWPKVVYEPYPIAIQQLDIYQCQWYWEGAARNAGFNDALVYGHKFKNENIDCIVAFIDSVPEISNEHVSLSYVQGVMWKSLDISEPGKMKCSGALRYSDLLAGKYSTDLASMIPALQERQYESILREGNFWCSYCRKQYPITQKVSRTIIGRDRKQVWNSWKGRYEDKACVTQTSMDFCSGQCAGYEQMSREG